MQPISVGRRCQSRQEYRDCAAYLRQGTDRSRFVLLGEEEEEEEEGKEEEEEEEL